MDKTDFNTYQLATNSSLNSNQLSVHNILNNIVSGISYNTNEDLTTIDNNLTITTGKNLLLGTTNVLNTLNAINQTLSGITYDLPNDITYINNDVILHTGNNLWFGDSYNVKNKIDEKAILSGINIFNGLNTFQNGTNKLIANSTGIYTEGYTSLNNGNLVILNGNTHSFRNIIMKNTAFLLENSSGLSSQLYQNSSTLTFDNAYINGSKINFNVRTPSTTDASGNSFDGTAKTSLLLDSNGANIDGNLSVNGSSTLGNGALTIFNDNVLCSKNFNITNGSSLLIWNPAGQWTKLNFDNSGVFDMYAILPDSKLQFRVQDASGNSVTTLISDSNETKTYKAIKYMNNNASWFMDSNDSKMSTINQVGNNMIINSRVNNGSIQFNAFNSSGSNVKVLDVNSSGTSLIGDCNIVSSSDGSKISTINQNTNNLVISNKNNGSLEFNTLNSSGSNVKVLDISSTGCDIVGNVNVSGLVSYVRNGVKIGTSLFLTGNTRNLVFPCEEYIYCNLTNTTYAIPYLLQLPVIGDPAFLNASITISILTLSTFVLLIPANFNTRIYDQNRVALTELMLTPDSCITITLTALTLNDWYVTSYNNNSNYLQALNVSTNSLTLYGPTTINTYIAPTDPSQIGYTFTGSYSQMVDSLTANNYTLLSSEPINFSNGTWIVNSRFEISTGGTSTTFKFGWTYSNSITSASKLNIMSASTKSGISVNKSIDSSFTYSENATFTHSFSSPAFVYLWYYIKWTTSGTLTVYYQCTRIA